MRAGSLAISQGAMATMRPLSSEIQAHTSARAPLKSSASYRSMTRSVKCRRRSLQTNLETGRLVAVKAAGRDGTFPSQNLTAIVMDRDTRFPRSLARSAL